MAIALFPGALRSSARPLGILFLVLGLYAESGGSAWGSNKPRANQQRVRLHYDGTGKRRITILPYGEQDKKFECVGAHTGTAYLFEHPSGEKALHIALTGRLDPDKLRELSGPQQILLNLVDRNPSLKNQIAKVTGNVGDPNVKLEFPYGDSQPLHRIALAELIPGGVEALKKNGLGITTTAAYRTTLRDSDLTEMTRPTREGTHQKVQLLSRVLHFMNDLSRVIDYDKAISDASMRRSVDEIFAKLLPFTFDAYILDELPMKVVERHKDLK